VEGGETRDYLGEDLDTLFLTKTPFRKDVFIQVASSTILKHKVEVALCP
jgi:hypothetical protein